MVTACASQCGATRPVDDVLDLSDRRRSARAGAALGAMSHLYVPLHTGA